MTVDKVLLSGDDGTVRALLEAVPGLHAPLHAFSIVECQELDEALAFLKKHPVALLVTVEPPAGGNSVDLIRMARLLHPGLPALVVARTPHPEAALAAMRAGADDYLCLDDPALVRLPWLAFRAVHGRGPRASRPLLRSLSHDLRSPLAALTALVQIMETDAASPLTQGQRARVRRIREAADRLTDMAAHLMDLAMIHDGRMLLSPVTTELTQAASLAVRRVQPLAASRAVELRLDIPSDLPLLEADTPRLCQAFELLLGGAVRQIEGGALVLSALGRSGRIEISLKEEPRPLPMEALPEVDEPLAAEDRLEGALGTTVARGLFHLHGGRLRLGASAGGGRLAVVELPCAPGQPASPAHRPRERRPHP